MSVSGADSHQVDWEAILNKSPKRFCASVSAWLLHRPSPTSENAADEADLLDNLPFVGDVFPTMRAIIEGLNNDGWQI
jgi:hypothetical protein